MRWIGRRRRDAAVAAQSTLFARRRILREDITVFGEELGQLHLDTLTDDLDTEARDYYRHALESYERAKARFDAAEDTESLDAVVKALVEGRHQVACVVALIDGRPPPARLEECFFNPQHGPSSEQVPWTPLGGVERTVAVCASDAQRLRVGQHPQVRLIRVGNNTVPWHVAGQDAEGYFPPVVDVAAMREFRRTVGADAMRHGFASADVRALGSSGFGGGGGGGDGGGGQ